MTGDPLKAWNDTVWKLRDMKPDILGGGGLAKDIKGPLKVGKEPIGSPKKYLLKVASRFVVVTPDKYMLQGMGFRCETGGNWSCRKKKSRRYCIWIMWHTLQSHLSSEGRDKSFGPYIRVWRRKTNWFLAYSRWNEPRPLRLGMEDDTVNVIAVQRVLGTYN